MNQNIEIISKGKKPLVVDRNIEAVKFFASFLLEEKSKDLIEESS
ncbi:MAG TPA: hypothetical protein VMZ29_07380 [Candidatus Bathyarchaeia archaeon]|nr:hypothetical protein [Candidatus Bathyarchaeia archaeon]